MRAETFHLWGILSTGWEILREALVGILQICRVTLQRLKLENQGLASFPQSIGNLLLLTSLLDLSFNQLSSLPESVGNLQKLEVLNLHGNKLLSLPKSIGNLQSLQVLTLAYNNLSSLPESIGHLSSLRELNLYSNQLTSLPESLGHLKSLKTLDLGRNDLKFLPESLGDLKSLKMLDLKRNQLASLPESIGNLKSLSHLSLSDNRGAWSPETVDRLVVSYQALASMKPKRTRRNARGCCRCRGRKHFQPKFLRMGGPVPLSRGHEKRILWQKNRLGGFQQHAYCRRIYNDPRPPIPQFRAVGNGGGQM